MTIEASQYINQLNTTFPRSTDLLKEGDDHIRLIKANLKNTFPYFTGATNISSASLNNINSLISASSATSLNFNQGFTISSGKNVNMGGNRVQNIAEYSDTTDALSLRGLRKFLALLLPVNAVWCTGRNNTNPGGTLGFGTWVPLDPGRYIASAGNGDYSIGTGVSGTKSFSLSVANMPAHHHNIAAYNVTSNAGSFTTSDSGNHTHGVQMRGSGDSGVNAITPSGIAWAGSTLTTSGAGNHHHTGSVRVVVPIPSKDTNTQGSGTAITPEPRRTGLYFWIRTA